MTFKACFALLFLAGMLHALDQPGMSSHSQDVELTTPRSLLYHNHDLDDQGYRDYNRRDGPRISMQGIAHHDRDRERYNDERDSVSDRSAQRDASYPSRDWERRDGRDRMNGDWERRDVPARMNGDWERRDASAEMNEDWDRESENERDMGRNDARGNGEFDERREFERRDRWPGIEAQRDDVKMQAESTSNKGSTIALSPGAKWTSYPWCGLDSQDLKCTDLFNQLYIPQQWGAVGRAFMYLKNSKDQTFLCQTQGVCKVLRNPFKANSKAYMTFTPLNIVKLSKAATISAGATFKNTSSLEIRGSKIVCKAAWSFESGSYLDVIQGGYLNLNLGSLLGRVEILQVVDSTLLAEKEGSNLAGPALITGSTVTQTSASFAFSDSNPMPYSPNLVDIIRTTWTVKSGSQLIFDSRTVYVATTRFVLENSELVLRNTTMQIFDSSLFLTNAKITLDKLSSLSLYNYRIVGDYVVSATDIRGFKNMVGQPLKSLDDYVVVGPGYICTKNA